MSENTLQGFAALIVLVIVLFTAFSAFGGALS